VVPDDPAMQRRIRAAEFYLAESMRPGVDWSLSPVGSSSSGYNDHVFWDAETWMYPSLLLLHPDLAASVVGYRIRTVNGARVNAEQTGYQGARFAWESANDGTEQTPTWAETRTYEQHITADVALALWQYYLATGDTSWLANEAWPVLEGTADFWASRATPTAGGGYAINYIEGPDEHHFDVDNEVYSNVSAITDLRLATKAAALVGKSANPAWTKVADGLPVLFDPATNVRPEFEGYTGDTIKQADVVMLTYPWEWAESSTIGLNDLNYYVPRTDPDGPAMTDSVHAVDAAEIGEPGCATHTYLMRAIKPFVRDPFAQFAEARGSKPGAQDPLAGAPAFNFLTGEGGFTQVFTNGLTGLRWRADRVHLDPMLPPQLKSGVTLKGLHWQGRTFDVSVGPDNTTVSETAGPPFAVESPQGTQMVSSGSPLTLKTRRPDLVPTDNVARCQLTQASSEEPGMYSEAAVDGSVATIWAPDDASGSIKVDLGGKILISRITPQWTDALPDTYQILTATDGTRWTPVATADPDGTLQHPVNARYVRVDLTQAASGAPTGIRELEVIRAAS
jgi:trehalose/maltose hydrolase-like predicted phosphorylase